MTSKLLLAAGLVAAIGTSAHANNITWSPTAGATAWATGSNWVGGAAPVSTDTATFDSTSYASQPNIAANSINEIISGDGTTATAALTISGSNTTPTIGSGGILINANSGAVTFSLGSGILELGASQTWTNNSSSLLTIGAVSTNAASGTSTVTLAGSGSGGMTISGIVSNGTNATTAVTVNYSGTGSVTLGGASTFTGGLIVQQGTVVGTNSKAYGGNSTGAVTLGTNGGTANVSLLNGAGSGSAYSNPITVASGDSGVMTIGNVAGVGNNSFSGAITMNNNLTIQDSGAADTGNDALTVSGGITGTGDLTLTNNNTATGITTLTLNNTTTGINMSGNIVANGTGTGNTVVSGNIGSNMGNVTQAGTNTLNLTGTDAYTGSLTIKSGSVILGSATASGTKAIQLGDSSGSAAATLQASTASVTNGINVGTSTGSLTVQGSTSGPNFSGAITLGSSSTATANVTLASGLAGTTTGSRASYTGGVTGFGNVTLNFGNTGSGAALTVSTTSVNNTGLISNVGSTGTLTTTLSAAVGSNVTGIVENGANSLTLSGNNTAFTGSVTVTTGTILIGSTTALDNAANVVNIASTGTLSSAASGATIAGINDSGSSGGGAIAITAGTLNLQGSGSYAFSGAISGTMPLTVAMGSGGKQTFSGTNSYTGATHINSGTLIINGNDTTATGAVSVANGAALGGTGSVGGAVTISAGGIINLEDGTIGTLSLVHTGTSLTLSGAGVLDIDVGTGTNSDLLALTGTGSFASNIFTVNVNSLTGATAGNTYDIVSAASGLSTANFIAGALSGTLAGDSMSIGISGGEITLTINGGSVSTTYYYTGAHGTTFSEADNYNDAASGGNVQSAGPGSTADVFIGTTSPTPSNVAPTLGSANASINSLTFTSTGANGSVNGSGALTINAASGQGITDNAVSGSTETLNAPVVLGASQTWTVTNAGDTLVEAGGISGPGKALTAAGSGTLKLKTDNTYSGGTTVGNGSNSPTLLLANGSGSAGSATGTGALLVNAGATIGGAGASRSTSFTIDGKIMVGTGTDTTSVTTITGSSASTIANAQLTFNLSSSNAGQANVLDLGATAISFSGTSALTLNISGGSIIAPNTAYVLITDSNGFAGSGLVLGNGGIILSGLTIAPSTFFGAESNGMTSGFYDGSYLFVNGDNIEVEVVPEPGTWAMLVGGLAMLVFWQRRRSRQV